MNAGNIIAVLINYIFSKTMHEILHVDLGFEIFWIWLNFTGVILSVLIAYVVGKLTKNVEVISISNFNVSIKKSDLMIKSYIF